MEFPISGVSHMLRRALNTLDYRLIDHGERVAYLVLKMMQKEGTHTERQLKEACYLAMLHDVGAYKTEVIDSLMDAGKLFAFEINNYLKHSIYSYLFLKKFSFFHEKADAVLFHHFVYPKLLSSDCNNKDLAAKIFMGDRIDIMFTKKIVKNAEEILTALNNSVFNPKDAELLRELEAEEGVLTKIFNVQYLEELLEILEEETFNDGERASLVEMLPYTIDFRSKNTVTHTVATVEATMTLAELLQVSEDDKTKLYYGALLHDIGKISTSLMILEKPDRLSDLEFNVMKDHVLMSEYILQGRVSKEIMNIAIRHHEKLDGTGYPYGIMGEQLTQNERIVAVADILSALLGRRSYKDPFQEGKVRKILHKMAEDGKICKEIVAVVQSDYAVIEERINAVNDKALEDYDLLLQEYEQLLDKYGKSI